MKKLFLIFALVFMLGCIQPKDFDYGFKQIANLNSKYNTTMDTYPQSINKIDEMHEDFLTLKRLDLSSGKELFLSLINYRILNLEAEKSFIESQKYGEAGTTVYGFGCKMRPLVIESASLRNISALMGFEAVNVLREFISKYPEESKSAGLSNKDALFLNATFYKISQGAESDSNIINYFCPKNETLESYQREFRRDNYLSEEEISKLTYEQAVSIWKKKNEII